MTAIVNNMDEAIKLSNLDFIKKNDDELYNLEKKDINKSEEESNLMLINNSEKELLEIAKKESLNSKEINDQKLLEQAKEESLKSKEMDDYRKLLEQAKEESLKSKEIDDRKLLEIAKDLETNEDTNNKFNEEYFFVRLLKRSLERYNNMKAKNENVLT